MHLFRHRRWLAAAALVGLAWSAACLPSLSPIGANGDVAVETDAETGSFSRCGDGIVDTLDDGGDTGESCDPGDSLVAGCEGCRFVCSGGRTDEAGHCYFFAAESADYGVAQSACVAQNAHVVTLGSEREAAFASAFASASDAGAYWVGLSVRDELEGNPAPYAPPGTVYEPGWPRSSGRCGGCFALGADDTNAFPSRSDAGGEERCLVAEPDAGWLRVPCKGGAGISTLCEREPVGQRQFFCGGAYCTTLAISAGRKRYVISIDELSAEEAATACEKRYGGSLVVLETREEREQLVAEIRKRASQAMTFWIGLSRSEAGVWAWDDDIPDDGALRPRQWGSGQPEDGGAGRRAFLVLTEELSRFDAQLAYSDDEQGPSARRYYVCQRPIGTGS